ncbi:bifunctional riboflavin kinase/FAD synthetase [Allofrancisella guangzhouensis]|uniref:Riboflavin biosynthesis protein n=1 Tax=Allofrancisella guangzhouensis TaxID=594679 RepID=A0A0A8E5J8_9GAMM|nr:bifunctional riboflavin kinase/FAD synthetase [Allofrancisella guangzhouensis]AJC49490.1 riboflavin biosynthesis protein RibF [Allofrancisella guangzhouensis]MBK2027970.1 bifunctional riboflavin kinase/FAD synthetase [Allofrancisella guangzhouensis]MBK2043984.1 bifunctional riboflavin kinase/FAD synthetase [Allofrancisella guangzhouensis]MBK2045900.1 bifunctional riboflavin kinase/FAD synthetase [Allofrancisella guangzhouensis]
MNITTHLNKFTSTKNTAIAIGAFDGVHLGHQAVINKLLSISYLSNLVPYIFFFEPLPKEFFRKDKPPTRIYDLRNKIININHAGIKNIICQKFDERFANIDAKEFVIEYLIKKLKTKHIIVGDDFRFGKDRKGNYELLEQLSKSYDFQVDKISTLNLNNQRVSSSQIRTAIEKHHLKDAEELLGKRISINSRVIHGQKNGRKIGFHTTNQRLLKNSVLKGVYLTKIYIDDEIFYGVSNAGTRPTIDGKNNLLETHIFDFNKEIYKKHITVEVLKFIRAEKKFNSFDELKDQITKDIQTAKRLISTS